jgi:hypothetical protein
MSPLTKLSVPERMILVRITSSSRPERSGVEGPSIHNKPLIIGRRSLHYASLRSAPVETTDQVKVTMFQANRTAMRRACNAASVAEADVSCQYRA